MTRLISHKREYCRASKTLNFLPPRPRVPGAVRHSYAAPQNRDRYERRAPLRPRHSSAPRREERHGLRCVRGAASIRWQRDLVVDQRIQRAFDVDLGVDHAGQLQRHTFYVSRVADMLHSVTVQLWTCGIC